MHPSLAPLLAPIESLREDPANARTHPEDNIAAIRASLEAFGQTLPVVARRSDGLVLAGNGRLGVARSLGWKFLAVVYTDDSDALASAFSRTDNRTAELATWDDARLAQALASLDERQRAATGFSGKKLDELLALAANNVKMPAAPKEFPKFGDDIPVAHKCPGCGYEWN